MVTEGLLAAAPRPVSVHWNPSCNTAFETSKGQLAAESAIDPAGVSKHQSEISIVRLPSLQCTEGFPVRIYANRKVVSDQEKVAGGSGSGDSTLRCLAQAERG